MEFDMKAQQFENNALNCKFWINYSFAELIQILVSEATPSHFLKSNQNGVFD